MYDEVIDSLKKEFIEKLNKIKDIPSLLDLKGEFVGRKRGKINELFKQMGKISAEKRKSFGQAINELKSFFEQELKNFEQQLKTGSLIKKEKDWTLPGYKIEMGSKHLLLQVMDEVVDIFLKMGYHIEDGPEVETDYYNFTALNIPEEHPARDEHDTFYIDYENRDNRYLLRTHTSPVQIRTMLKKKPPLKIIIPGKVFRKDEPDDTHSPVFHQLEGLVVGKKISMADLKGTLTTFLKALFKEDVKVRFRPSFFPFTEPSAEVDVMMNGEWLEILGCGMVDPAVFDNVGIDSEEYTGFAFGLGIDRIAMVKYRARSLRLFYENDLRFLRQF
jgi:phenylalanyl-tRNA synthetase alpha chain